MGNNLLGQQTTRVHHSKHVPSFSTIGSTTTSNHCNSSLMSLNPLAPAFLPQHQSSSGPSVMLDHSYAMNFPLVPLPCGLPPQSIPLLTSSINQQPTDSTLLLPLLQSTNQSTADTIARKPISRSSTLLPSSLQNQTKCLQTINNSLQQFNQHLKEEKLDRQILQLLALQLQNDFAVLRYLLFSSTGTLPNKDVSVQDTATSPISNPIANPNPDVNHNPNPNPNPNPSPQLPSSAFPFTGPRAPTLHRSTPVGAVGSARATTNNTANADSQPTPNTQETPSTTVQNLTSRICKMEKLLANEISSYTSITAGIHSQYFFLYDKIRQLEPGNSDAIIWKIPSVKFVFDSAKVARSSSDPLTGPATSFSSPIFRTHPHGYNFFIKLYPYGIGPATGKCASILFTLFPGDYDNLLQWPFSKIIHIGIRDQLYPMNTGMKTIRPDQDPAFKKPTMSTKTGTETVLINNFIPHSKLFSETEGFLIDGASFIEIKFSDPPVPEPFTQTSLLFPFP